jgi:hypothetical protein
VGVVTEYRIENGNLIGKLKMSRTPEVASLLQDLEDGIVRSVSLGYRVYKYVDITTPTDEMRILRAVDWEPMEVSLVSIPFDPLAQVRNAPSIYSAVIETKKLNEGEQMPKLNRSAEEVEKPAAAAPEVNQEAPAVEAEKVAEEKPAEAPAEAEKAVQAESPEAVRSAERERSSQIVEAVRKAGLELNFAEELITKGTEIAEARSAIIDAVADRGAKPLSNKTEIKVGEEKADVLKRGIVNAVMHKVDPKVALTEDGRSFRGMSLTQMGAECLELAGIKTRGMTKMEIANKVLSHDFHIRAGAHGTGDFASLLADVANKTLRKAYEESPQTFKPFVRAVTAPDFKNINRVQLGEFANLELVGEHGNLQYGTISDGKELFKILSYAKGLKLTKQAIVNDDMDGFGRSAMLMGRASARLESDLVYSILLANANMGDGVALFYSTHKNLGTTGAISETTLKEMKMLGRKQTGLNGAILNLQYKHLIVSPELEVAAQKQISAIVPNQASGVNPFVGQFNLIVDARVSLGTGSPASTGSATVWFGAADPAEIDTIEVATLEGQSGPMIVEDVDFDTQGVRRWLYGTMSAQRRSIIAVSSRTLELNRNFFGLTSRAAEFHSAAFEGGWVKFHIRRF